LIKREKLSKTVGRNEIKTEEKGIFGRKNDKNDRNMYRCEE